MSSCVVAQASFLSLLIENIKSVENLNVMWLRIRAASLFQLHGFFSPNAKPLNLPSSFL
jgi:hypothetical protein